MSSRIGRAAANEFTVGMQLLLGAACALLIASLYYAQPLTSLIGDSLGLSSRFVGLIVTLPLFGYGAGLLFFVPLGDVVENRRLVLALVGAEAVCLVVVCTAVSAPVVLAASFVLGVAAAAIQILLPYTTFLAPEAVRGQAIGKLVSSIMLGILIARPASSLVADLSSWRATFGLAAVLMGALFIVLYLALPARHPQAQVSYVDLVKSMGFIFVSTELLRRRAIYHACMFGAFIVFWTAVPLWLGGPQFGLTQTGIAWVALAGAAGAVAPPLAGRLGDRGFARPGMVAAYACATGAFVFSCLAVDGSLTSIIIVTLSGVALDFAVAAHLVFCQRAIYSLGESERSRVNALFMAIFFGGGSFGSVLGVWAYSQVGWIGVAILGATLPMAAFLYFATDRSEKH